MTVTVGSSLPSTPVTCIDIPEVSNFTGQFVYNYFTTDELTNDNATTTAASDSVIFSRTVARYVHLKWNKITFSSTGKQKQELIDISIQNFASEVIDEDNVDLRFYQTYEQQENNFVLQTQHYLDRLYRQLNYNPLNASLGDAARAINESTPPAITQEFISRYLNYSHSENLHTTANATNPASDIEGINTAMPVINKAFGTLFHEKLINDSLTPLDRTLLNGLDEKFNIKAMMVPYANQFNGSQYDLSLDNPIRSVVTDTVRDFGTVFQATGYVIDRYRLLADGQPVDKKSYYIENPETVEFFDTQVAYNQRYYYTIKTVAVVRTLTFNAEQRVNVVSTHLIASKRVRFIANCVDKTPPEPPTDFFVSWDYGLKKPVLTWNFPIDSRRHIKYFMVFRRRNLTINGLSVRPAQLPFELVRMYDFNDLQGAPGVFYNKGNGIFTFFDGDSAIIADIIMTPASTTATTVFTPTCYIDEDFNREDYYIYSVVAVDAHGISSNYSNQIGIRFSKPKNTIDRVDISGPGAPKPYPNIYLNKDAFVDTIKNEGYSQLTVVFSPEYYELRRQSGEDLKILNFGPDNFYRIQLINTDLQTDQFIDIRITDDRVRS